MITTAAHGASVNSVEFNGRSVRVLIDGDSMVLVAKDLVEAVGATWNGSQSVGHIPEEYRGVRSVLTPSGVQQMSVLTEAGMNMYLFRSDKPAALPWQRHLAEVVLPSIRKTGQYQAAPVSLAQQALLASQALVAIEQAQQEHNRRIAAIEADKLRAEAEAREVGALPAAPVEVSERSYGQMTTAIVNSWASNHNGNYRETYRTFYQAVEERAETRIDLKTRLANAKAKRARGEKEPRLSDIIDASGKGAEIYAIARQLFATRAAS